MRTYLLVNAIITPDGTRLESAYTHDYQSHVDANGETYMVDGGLDYIRRSVNNAPAVDDCVYTDSGHHKIRKHFKWGTYGKSGREKFTRIPLKDLSDEHIEAILKTQSHLDDHIKKVFYDEITYRKTIANEKTTSQRVKTVKNGNVTIRKTVTITRTRK